MDSMERDKRAEDGFSERGDILYDAGERDERNNFKKERLRKRKEKDLREYDPSDDEVREKNPNNVNDQTSKKMEEANEYGLDDEEFEDIAGLPEEEEEDNYEDKEE